MSKRKTRKASWLLTVASAYSVLPGCSDDSSAGKPDSSMASADGGSAVARSHRDDAAAPRDAGNDAGDRGELDAGEAAEEELDFTTLIGVIIFPPDCGDLPELDAGSTATPPADDAGPREGVILPVGLVALPPDASPGAAPSLTTLARPPQKTPGT